MKTKTLILSPHTDDAIFSLGDFIQTADDVTVLSVFSGVPPMSLDDGIGYQKHATLRVEHGKACRKMGIKYINGDFLDDVYNPRPTEDELRYWLNEYLPKYNQVICPLGIHHPDHIQLRNVATKFFKIHYFYKDLPYAELYPELLKSAIAFNRVENSYKVGNIATPMKVEAVKCYYSQIQNDHILDEILVQEELYA